MAKPRFLLDENVDRGVQRRLRRLEHTIDVLSVGDPGAPSAGTSDREILTWIEEHGYILVTGNRRSIPDHLSAHFAAGRHIPGLFYLRPQAVASSVASSLHLIWQASELEEYRDQPRYLPI